MPALFLALALLRQTPDVDAIVEKHLQATSTPGCSVAVVRDGKVLFAKGYGLANVEAPAPATADTVYRIGSVTKQFTATLVMQLVQAGKVKLDEPIVTYLPDLPSAYKPVTVRQLLNHTSGIRSYTSIKAFADRAKLEATPMEMAKMSSDEKTDFAPGTAWKYNNTGYVVLGMLVEKVGGKPYGELLASRITGPLGMTKTDVTDLAQVVPGRAAGYGGASGELKNADYLSMSWPYSAGAIESTVTDLAKWDIALEGVAVLPQAALKQMWTPTTLSDGKTQPYGFGWAVPVVNGVHIIEHGGAINGFRSYIGRIPAKRTSVIVLTNSDNGNPEALGRQILGVYVPEVKPAEAKPITDADKETTSFLRGRFDALLKGTLTADDLTPEFAKVLTAERIKEAKEAIGSLGEITKFDLIKTTTQGDAAVRVYRVTVGPAPLTVTFVLTKTRKISGMRIEA